MHMLFSVSPFTVPSNARLNRNFKMTLDNSYMCLKVHCSCSMGNDRIARIVGLIQINHLSSSLFDR